MFLCIVTFIVQRVVLMRGLQIAHMCAGLSIMTQRIFKSYEGIKSASDSAFFSLSFLSSQL